MSNGKTLAINCAICDTRKIQESAYEEYDKIMLNAAMIFVNERSRAILEKLNIRLNAGDVIELDDDSQSYTTVVVNGSSSIGSSVPSGDDIIMLVNGELTISPGAEEAMRHYKKILVNGGVLCPESMTAHLSCLSINGITITYPDDYTILPENFIIDKYFPLRAANNGKYFVPDTAKLLDRTVDLAALAEKNVRFMAKKLLLPEEKAKELVPLFGEATEIIAAPSGFAIVDGDAKLDEELLRRCGNKIFVYGSLDARGDISAIVPQIDELIVTGKVTLTKKGAAEFSKIKAEYRKIDIVKGTLLRLKQEVRLDGDALKLAEDGISVMNCAAVTLENDLTPEDIMQLIDMKNIGTVICSKEQRVAVEMVGVNIGAITTEPLGEAEPPADKNVVNAREYVM